MGRGPHLISIVDSDGPIEVTDFSGEQLFEVITTKILKGCLYLYPALRLLKGKEVARLESKEEYLFDISKVTRWA